MAMYTTRYAGGSDATLLIATSIGIDAISVILFYNGYAGNAWYQLILLFNCTLT